MKPQNAWVPEAAQYHEHSLNPGAANIVRLQPMPVPEAGYENMQGPHFRLQPVHPHTEAQRLEVMPPIVETWRLGPINQTLPTLFRACVGGPEDTIVYCLKMTCLQCSAAQVFPTFASLPTEEMQQVAEGRNYEFWNTNGNEMDRVPTGEEMQQETEGRNNEFCNYNGNEIDRLVPDETGQQGQSSDPPKGSKYVYLNPDAPEFYGPQVESVKPVQPVKQDTSPEPVKQDKSPEPVKQDKSPEPVKQDKSPKILNPEAPPFFGPVETTQKSSGRNTQSAQKPHVQNTKQNERRSRNRRFRQNNRPRNRPWPANNYQDTKGRGSNSTQQLDLPQNQHVIPGDAELARLFQDTTIPMIERLLKMKQ